MFLRLELALRAKNKSVSIRGLSVLFSRKRTLWELTLWVEHLVGEFRTIEGVQGALANEHVDLVLMRSNAIGS